MRICIFGCHFKMELLYSEFCELRQIIAELADDGLAQVFKYEALDPNLDWVQDKYYSEPWVQSAIQFLYQDELHGGLNRKQTKELYGIIKDHKVTDYFDPPDPLARKPISHIAGHSSWTMFEMFRQLLKDCVQYDQALKWYGRLAP